MNARSQHIGPFLHLKVKLTRNSEAFEGWVDGLVDNLWRITAPGKEPIMIDPAEWKIDVIDDDKQSWRKPPL